jgi:hypothetical protein
MKTFKNLMTFKDERCESQNRSDTTSLSCRSRENEIFWVISASGGTFSFSSLLRLRVEKSNYFRAPDHFQVPQQSVRGEVNAKCKDEMTIVQDYLSIFGCEKKDVSSPSPTECDNTAEIDKTRRE